MQDNKRISFATYNQDYFTGSQVKVYFGSVFVDDIATIQYTSQHSKAPLYGYNDHQFRAVAKGQFLVNGTFTVAFKETGYLNVIMNLIKKDSAGLNQVLQEPNATQTLLNYISHGYTPEEALDIASSQKKSKQFGFKDQQDFEDIAEVMEDSIWGKQESTAALGNKRLSRSDEMDYGKNTGNVKVQANDIDAGGFDILITFGDYRTGSDQPEHTMIAINDVHITGESMVVTPAGEPIGIQYTFFARGLNEKVSNIWPKQDKELADLAPGTLDAQDMISRIDNSLNQPASDRDAMIAMINQSLNMPDDSDEIVALIDKALAELNSIK